MTNGRGLRLFGFPVDVRPGFIILMALFAFVYSGQGRGDLGLWLAAAVAGFTLLHELGHAFAARATGAEASISLDFLAGYASFEPTRPLKRWERAGISVAGPAVQIVGGAAVLVALGHNPLEAPTLSDSAVVVAVWWAGPVIGLINLAPILPLDGGHIVMSGLDVFVPGRSRIVMIYVSLALTVAGLVVVSLGEYPVSPLFLVFPLVVQLQMLQHRHTQSALDEHGTLERWASAAERDAWNTGRQGKFPPGLMPSPWFRAALLGRAGRLTEARDVLLDSFTTRQPPNWVAPHEASERELEALVNLLPRPLPTGNVYAEYVLAEVLVRLGEYEAAGQYAAANYMRERATMPAVVVAQCAAALGDHELAVRWLRAASDAGTNLPGLADAIEHRAEFQPLRDRPDVVRLRHELMSAT